MEKEERVYSEDMIGKIIKGYIPGPNAEILLLDDGRTIEIHKDYTQNDEMHYVIIGTWKPTQRETRARIPTNGATH